MIWACSARLDCASSYGFGCGVALTPALSRVRERGQYRIVLGAQPALIGLVATRIQPCQRHIAAWLVHVADDTRSAPLLDQAHAFPDEDRAAEAVVLGNASAQRVVVESRCLRVLLIGARPSGSADFDESALVIPTEALGRVPATELLDQAPMAVVEEALVFEDANQVVFDVAGLGVLGSCAERLLGGAIEDVAGRVVLEGFAGCRAVAGKGLAGASFDSSGGVVAMGRIAMQAVARLTQLTHLVIGIGLHQAIERALVGRARTQDGLLPALVLRGVGGRYQRA